MNIRPWLKTSAAVTELPPVSACLILPLAAVLLAPSPGNAARTVTLSGGASSGIEFTERRYDENVKTEGTTEQRDRNDEDEGDVQKYYFAPTLTLKVTGVRDELDLQYTPKVNYDGVVDENNIDHSLLITGKRFVTRDLQIIVDERFVAADDLSRSNELAQASASTTAATSAGTELPRDELATDVLRQRYYTNTATLRGEYTFAKESKLNLGYTNGILRNDSAASTRSEFDRHELATGVGWKPHQNWTMALDGFYVIGDYSPVKDEIGQTAAATTTSTSNEEDLHEYRAKGRLTYLRDSHTSYPLTYDFKSTDYDGDRADSRVHEAVLGWDHTPAADLRLLLGAGPAYSEVDGKDASWGYSGHAGLEKKLSRGQLTCRLEKRYETDNFTGTNNNGLADVYTGLLQYTHHLTDALDGKVLGKIRDEKRLDPQGQYDTTLDTATTDEQEYHKRRYEIGLGVSYGFWQWYALDMNYTYAQQDADLAEDAYDEHLVTVRISMTKEWWRW